MSNYVNIYLRDTLSRVPGVGSIQVFGAKDFSMRIWLNPELLKARGLTTMDVIGAIREQNVQVAAGQIGAPPSPAGQEFQYTVKTLGRLSSAEQFGDIVVKVGRDGRVLRLKDVARIELGSQLYNWFVEYNGTPSVAMGVFQLPGANSLEVAESIREAMDKLSRDFPKGLEYIHQGGAFHAAVCGFPGDPDRLYFSAGLSNDSDSIDHNPRLADRDVRCDDAPGHVYQHADAFRAGAVYRHRC